MLLLAIIWWAPKLELVGSERSGMMKTDGFPLALTVHRIQDVRVAVRIQDS